MEFWSYWGWGCESLGSRLSIGCFAGFGSLNSQSKHLLALPAFLGWSPSLSIPNWEETLLSGGGEGNQRQHRKGPFDAARWASDLKIFTWWMLYSVAFRGCRLSYYCGVDSTYSVDFCECFYCMHCESFWRLGGCVLFFSTKQGAWKIQSKTNEDIAEFQGNLKAASEENPPFTFFNSRMLPCKTMTVE